MRSISKSGIAERRYRRLHVGAVVGACVMLALGVFCSLGRAATPPAAVTRTVTIAGLKFSPSSVTIHLGDRVVFKNEDIMPHSATAKDPPGFDSDIIKAGESWSVAPERAGTIKYACKFHPLMEGTIVVEGP